MAHGRQKFGFGGVCLLRGDQRFVKLGHVAAGPAKPRKFSRIVEERRAADPHPPRLTLAVGQAQNNIPKIFAGRKNTAEPIPIFGHNVPGLLRNIGKIVAQHTLGTDTKRPLEPA